MPLEQCDQPLQAGAQIACGIIGTIHVEGWLEAQLVTTLQPARKRRQDRHAGRARQPHWAEWERGLFAEEGHWQAVPGEVAIGGEPDQLAPAQRLHHSADAPRRCRLDTQSPAGT